MSSGTQLEPDFSGFIALILPESNSVFIGTVIVESHADKLLSRVVVNVKTDTPIILFENSESNLVSFNRLNIQDRVHIWYAGLPQKGFPAVATAEQIYIFRND